MPKNRQPLKRPVLKGPVVCRSAAIAKRRYTAPTLRVYGSIRQITLGASTGAGDGLSGRAPQLSDRSTKENIVRIGTHPLGIGLYLFDYKQAYRAEDDQGRHFGVMADEVESVLPQAVGRHVRGPKTVDYAMLGIFDTVSR